MPASRRNPARRFGRIGFAQIERFRTGLGSRSIDGRRQRERRNDFGAQFRPVDTQVVAFA